MRSYNSLLGLLPWLPGLMEPSFPAAALQLLPQMLTCSWAAPAAETAAADAAGDTAARRRVLVAAAELGACKAVVADQLVELKAKAVELWEEYGVCKVGGGQWSWWCYSVPVHCGHPAESLAAAPATARP